MGADQEIVFVTFVLPSNSFWGGDGISGNEQATTARGADFDPSPAKVTTETWK
jgi:hypothetical protein